MNLFVVNFESRTAIYSFTDSLGAAVSEAVVVTGPLLGGKVSEAILPEWLLRLYQSATMPLSVDWLEHWLVCLAPSLLRQLAPLLLSPLLLLLELLLLIEIIE